MLDAVDGIVARRYGPVTVLGKAMDPFGDALFFLAAALGCYLLGIVPLWLAALIAFRYAAPVLATPGPRSSALPRKAATGRAPSGSGTSSRPEASSSYR